LIDRREVEQSLADPDDWSQQQTEVKRLLPIDTLEELRKMYWSDPQSESELFYDRLDRDLARDTPSRRYDFQDAPEWATSPIQSARQRVGRNDPCPCGSGKKYKKCCGQDG
jgi:uncharacterized protein YecA (UPF0149 family)